MNNDNMIGIELKPCPFCGNKAQFRNLRGEQDGKKFKMGCRIACYSCHIGFEDYDIFEWKDGKMFKERDGYLRCVELWNRRAGNG